VRPLVLAASRPEVDGPAAATAGGLAQSPMLWAALGAGAMLLLGGVIAAAVLLLR
jgi:hypothetical protein